MATSPPPGSRRHPGRLFVALGFGFTALGIAAYAAHVGRDDAEHEVRGNGIGTIGSGSRATGRLGWKQVWNQQEECSGTQKDTTSAATAANWRATACSRGTAAATTSARRTPAPGVALPAVRVPAAMLLVATGLVSAPGLYYGIWPVLRVR